MKLEDGRKRAAISQISPQIEEGRFAIKRIMGDEVSVSADIFTDGHSLVSANLLFRANDQAKWQETPMNNVGNDRWTGQFKVEKLGVYFYTIQAWVDYFRTWQQELEKKFKAGIHVPSEIEMGLKMIKEALSKKRNAELKRFLTAIENAKHEEERVRLAIDERLTLLMRDCYPNKHWISEMERTLSVIVDPPKARFSAWYEIFPRSFNPTPGKHGTFKDCLALIPEIAQMGFDVLYFPPIHPIGYSKRKGKKNSPEAQKHDPGSPWAIGSHEGGHKAIHPELGTMEDFEKLIKVAREQGIDIAMDIAFQCSLDHPYLKEHPDWFRWRPDGSIQYAENPPKKYEDIVPFCFETEDWENLWKELRSIFLFWIKKGVRIFRVDNPHTKPFPLWEWIIRTIKQEYPEVIFLAEAFTRPKVMYWLAKIGFSQSYTYFTWRHTKRELTDYVKEIALSDIAEYFRPNFWTNTPDILTEQLQRGSRPLFLTRLILAATLSSNYGMYGPAFELIEQDAIPGTEEYLHSEKYQLRHWNKADNKSLAPMIANLNAIRRKHPCLQCTSNLKFYDIDNDQILYYGKFSSNPRDALLILVNLDPINSQSCLIKVPLAELGLPSKGSYKVHELLSDRYFIWEGEMQSITLDSQAPACLFSIQSKIRREIDFEYFL
ncbi:alpha-1,4-glucan--maltose-1-phosphate maltosyltransferase [Candidatus Protochlamydia phocaeensis]|uniref:alpha-1,4-glucan--maltose-1-phosphate maltosyltransferase n=1 Tax=Candidatus Protochlamydia phocaeensis TaxID=1414722 RepID=UPI000838E43C|nr:alpha-1,4-glucan--maltose-1-phosphate maltosyltransferase [Candidatus Protochlamydia phocaeensis]